MISRLLAGLIALLAVLGLWLRPSPEWGFQIQPGADVSLPPEFNTVFNYPSPEGTAHAPAIRVLEEGFELFWFDGIRESHNDVRILATTVKEGQATAVAEKLSRQTLSRSITPRQEILTLGNPVADGRDGMLVTAVSLGGWAAASVVQIEDGTAQALNLSPLLNRSHLVKSPVLQGIGGNRILPTYFEMGRAYGVAAVLDSGARVRGLARMPGDMAGIQPLIIPLSEGDAVALLRRFDGTTDRLLSTRTQDGGRTWSPLRKTELPNPSAPVAGVRLSDGRILIAYNDAPDRADVLRFAVSDDGGERWTKGRVIDGPERGDLRYPMMRVLSDGRIALTYSEGSKAVIVAHVFSATWALEQ